MQDENNTPAQRAERIGNNLKQVYFAKDSIPDSMLDLLAALDAPDELQDAA